MSLKRFGACGCLLATFVSALIGFLFIAALEATPATACNTASNSNGGSGGEVGAMLAAKSAIAAGFRGQLLVTMIAVAGGESGYNPKSYNGICCYGLWQINLNHGYSIADMENPMTNGQEAMTVYRGQGLNMASWEAYGNGHYLGNMGIAQKVVDQLQSSGQIPNAPCTLSTISAGPVGPCGGGNGTAAGSPSGALSSSSGGICGSVGGYINPIQKGLYTPARTDQGTDWLPQQASTPVIAIGNAKITYAQSSGTGWPRKHEGDGAGGCVVYQLQGGSLKDKFIYVCEDIDPTVKVGDTVHAGQTIANAHYDPPNGCCWTEWGWASGPGPSVLTPYGAGGNGYCTNGGIAFARFIHSLGGPWATVDKCPYSTGQFPPGPNYP